MVTCGFLGTERSTLFYYEPCQYPSWSWFHQCHCVAISCFFGPYLCFFPQELLHLGETIFSCLARWVLQLKHQIFLGTFDSVDAFSKDLASWEYWRMLYQFFKKNDQFFCVSLSSLQQLWSMIPRLSSTRKFRALITNLDFDNIITPFPHLRHCRS